MVTQAQLSQIKDSGARQRVITASERYGSQHKITNLTFEREQTRQLRQTLLDAPGTKSPGDLQRIQGEERTMSRQSRRIRNAMDRYEGNPTQRGETLAKEAGFQSATERKQLKAQGITEAPDYVKGERVRYFQNINTGMKRYQVGGIPQEKRDSYQEITKEGFNLRPVYTTSSRAGDIKSLVSRIQLKGGLVSSKVVETDSSISIVEIPREEYSGSILKSVFEKQGKPYRQPMVIDIPQIITTPRGPKEVQGYAITEGKAIFTKGFGRQISTRKVVLIKPTVTAEARQLYSQDIMSKIEAKSGAIGKQIFATELPSIIETPKGTREVPGWAVVEGKGKYTPGYIKQLGTGEALPPFSKQLAALSPWPASIGKIERYFPSREQFMAVTQGTPLKGIIPIIEGAVQKRYIGTVVKTRKEFETFAQPKLIKEMKKIDSFNLSKVDRERLIDKKADKLGEEFKTKQERTGKPSLNSNIYIK